MPLQLDFAALLVIAAFVTGTIWLWDKWVLARQRSKTLELGHPGRAVGARDRSKVPWYIDFSRSFFPVILAVLVLRSFVVEPFRIPSGSMEPTLQAGDFILVNKFSYGLRLPVAHSKILDLGEPQRGDVVVFRFPVDPATAFIKRIVGLPGDRLQYRDRQLTINGEPVPLQRIADDGTIKPNYEHYLEELGDNEHLIQVRKGRDDLPQWEVTVPEGHYFVLGDNRNNSRDSRYWKFLPEENLIGKAFFIWMNSDCVFFNGHCNRIGRIIE